VPKVFASGQGGLRCRARPRLARNHMIISLRRAAGAGALARARLMMKAHRGSAWSGDLPPGRPALSGNHFGCRIVQTPDVPLSDHRRPFHHPRPSAGSRQSYRQDRPHPARRLGAASNPFVGKAEAKPETWSYGHRNARGLALHPQAGKLWSTSTGRAAAWRSTSSRRAGTTAGR
jgi:glucose/arabinose dehydrogenase